MAHVRTAFGRLLAFVRRASRWVRRALTLALLAVVYVALLPFAAAYLRMRAPRAAGLLPRTDPDVGSLARLRRRQ